MKGILLFSLDTFYWRKVLEDSRVLEVKKNVLNLKEDI